VAQDPGDELRQGEYHAQFRDYFADNPTGGGADPLPFRELVPGLWLQDIQINTGNAMTVATDEGLVQVDSGMNIDRAAEMLAALREVTSDPVYAIVYSHGHIAYNEGLPAWLEEAAERGDPPPRVIGHENVLKRYARYRDTAGYQERANEIQNGFAPGSLAGFFDDRFDPTETHRDGLKLVGGSRRVELIYAPAETDDATGIWLPDDGILYGGGATIGGFPNIGSPLRTPRDPKRWADTLEKYLALEAELLIREYGPEVRGSDDVALVLSTTRDVLRYLRQETIDRLNRGMLIGDIIHDIEVPDNLVAYPWLAQTYGCCEYVIRDTYRLETGWWDLNVTNLHPARPDDVATEIAAVITDQGTVMARAAELHELGEHQMALHVIDLIAGGSDYASTTAQARALKRDVLLALADACPVFQSENFYRTAAAQTT
jgi:alkyl sulfatase BDS1-like metallo-beta-lactamase superfamily hydrolase